MGFEDEENNTTSKGKPPIASWKAGGVELSVWENEGKHGKYNTFNIKRNYKDEEEWKETQSLREVDLPKAIALLQKAFNEATIKDKTQK